MAFVTAFEAALLLAVALLAMKAAAAFAAEFAPAKEMAAETPRCSCQVKYMAHQVQPSSPDYLQHFSQRTHYL